MVNNKIVLFINNSGWLIKNYTSSQEVQNIVLSNDLAGIIFKDKVETVEISPNTSGSVYEISGRLKGYDSKESYIDNPDVGNYFNLNWKDNFGYTGNSDVTVRCNILDTFKLHNCELIKK